VTTDVSRRKFIAGVGSVLIVGTFAARAQQSGRVRRVAALIGYAENDPETKPQIAALIRGLRDLGWIEGRNVEILTRFSGGDVNRVPTLAQELLDKKPDVFVASTTTVTAELARRTKTIPIIFVVVSDPVGTGLIASLARPGGNITGFINVEDSVGGKWLALLKEAAPRTTRALIVFNPDTAPYAEYYLHPLEAAAASLAVEPIRAPVRTADEIEDVLAKFATEPDGGVIGLPDSFLSLNRQRVTALTSQYHLPTVFGIPQSGALISYAPDTCELFLRSASYVDRTLRGISPAELPVQVPTKFEMAVDLKTAKILGLTVPDSLLMLADEVIE
jgi:putative tryptophan/tyrosine transport system substrate-binding protein